MSETTWEIAPHEASRGTEPARVEATAGVRPGRIPLGVLLIALTLGSAVALCRPYDPTDDAAQHDQIAQNLLAGHGFSLDASAPFAPSMYREPAYPLFLSGIFFIAGHRYPAVQLAQVLLFVLTVLLTYLVGMHAFNARIGRIAALVVALMPALAGYPRYLLSETLYSCLLLALVWALGKTVPAGRLWWFVAAGWLWGATVLCRATAIVLIAPIGLVWWMLHRREQGHVMRRAAGYAAFLLAAAVLVAPWVARNRGRFGDGAFVALRGGRAVWERAQRIEDAGERALQTVVFTLSERAGKALFPDAAQASRDFLLRESTKGNEQVAAWQAAGLTEFEIDRRFMAEGLARIRQHPVIYAFQSGLELLKMTAFGYLPLLNEPDVQAAFQQSPSGRAFLALVKALLRLLALPLLVLAGVGAYANRVCWRRWLWIALPVLVFNLAHALLNGYGRYAVPLLPYYAVFAAAGWAALPAQHRAAHE